METFYWFLTTYLLVFLKTGLFQNNYDRLKKNIVNDCDTCFLFLNVEVRMYTV